MHYHSTAFALSPDGALNSTREASKSSPTTLGCKLPKPCLSASTMWRIFSGSKPIALAMVASTETGFLPNMMHPRLRRSIFRLSQTRIFNGFTYVFLLTSISSFQSPYWIFLTVSLLIRVKVHTSLKIGLTKAVEASCSFLLAVSSGKGNVFPRLGPLFLFSLLLFMSL